MKINFRTGRPVWPTLPPGLQEIVELYQVAYFAPDPTILLVTLAVYAAFLLGDSPLWLMIVGGASSGKTATMDSIRLLPNTYQCSTITAPALLSGTPGKERAKDAKGGLLREVGEAGMLLLKDFTSMLSMGRDAQREVLAALREIYDGKWVRRVGSDGGKQLMWEGKLAILAACTTSIDDHSHVMAAMGERFLYYRLPELEPDDQEKMAAMASQNLDAIKSYRQSLAELTETFFQELEVPAELPEADAETLDFLKSLATLVARCRSAVTRDSRSREIETIHAPEEPARIMGQLRLLEAGLAIIGVPLFWRLRIVRRVGLDCMPPLRRRVLERLARSGGPVDLASLAQSTKHPKTTTWRALDDLRAHGVVKLVDDAALGSEAKAGNWLMRDEWRERWNRFPKSNAKSWCP